jgi:transposase
MEARDFRRIGRPAQEELRRRALVLILQQGLSQAQAAAVVGVQRPTVNIWLKRYRAPGADGVLDGRRVSPRRGRGRLTADEAAKVQGWIRDRTPDQRKLPFALWTSRAVRDLIARRFGRTLGRSTVQLYLQRWNMTPQKPLARARERQPAAVAAWLETAYPAIARRAKAEGAAIWWGDGGVPSRPAGWGGETGISNHRAPPAPDPSAPLARASARAGDQIGRSYAAKGQTPVIVRTAKRVTQSMIAAVSNRGLMRFMLDEGALNAAVDPRCGSTIAFLRRLARDAGQKVFLIVDHLKVHPASKVKTWVAGHAHEIELFYLPAIGPARSLGEMSAQLTGPRTTTRTII